MAIIFAECGLLVGFVLPGDSLLFMVGMFIASGAIDIPLPVACLLLTISAVAGNLVGYWIGYRAGPPLFNRPDSRLFRQRHVDKTHEFFERYGSRATVLARFVPIVRTFITAMAGVGRMDFRRYAIYPAIGGVLWVTGVTVAGYYLGNIQFHQGEHRAGARGHRRTVGDPHCDGVAAPPFRGPRRGRCLKLAPSSGLGARPAFPRVNPHNAGPAVRRAFEGRPLAD